MSRIHTGPYSEQISGFSYRRLSELAGLGFFTIALFFFLALISYDKEDPSFNLSTERLPANWGGIPGAYAADLMLQLFGIASAMFVLVMLAWGWRLFTARRVTRLWLRVTALCVIVPAIAMLFAHIEAPLSWPIETGLGGAVGMLVKASMDSKLPVLLNTLLSLVVTAISLPVVMGLRASEWRALIRLVGKLLSGVVFIAIMLWPRRRFGQDMFDAAEDEYRESLLTRIKNRWRAREEAAHTPPSIIIRGEQESLFERTEPKISAARRQASFDLPAKIGKYELPSMSFLAEADRKKKRKDLNESALAQNARLLESVLQDFGVKGEIVKIRPGPVVTLYELEPSPGTKSSRVIGLADDIARSMSANSARIAVIPGRNAIGIELPNMTRETVYLRELLEDDGFKDRAGKLSLALGKDIGGDAIIVDLERMPHLLVAGTTGSGKSVAINTMIMSLIYRLSPEQCKFIMIDPKMLELSVYDDIPHLLAPVVTEPGKAVVALKWTVREMENRYRLMSNLGVRNIDGYNTRIREAAQKGEVLNRTVQTGFDPETGRPIFEEVPLEMNPLPFIVVVVDEMADLMLVAGKEIESSIQRLAQMARAAGIHIIMATQRPSVDVITGVIKANFPTRISFQVTSRIDSRTILGEQGAEQLLGQGDMLYMAGGGRITRVHGPFISDKEVEEIVSYVKTQGQPSYIEGITEEQEENGELSLEGGEEGEDKELYEQAVMLVSRDRKASTSYLQRCLKIGYNRAARLVDRMERDGIVGPANHVGKREVIGRG